MRSLIRKSKYKTLLTVGTFVLTVAAVATPTDADAAVAYVRSQVSAPWGSTSNEEAMDLVFGAGEWDDLRFETVDPAVLLSPTYSFLYIEGSDSNASELEAFLLANQAALEAWVSAGGRLFLNAGPNEGANQDWGFGGVTLNYPDFPADPGMPDNALHPIWTGPFLPTARMFTGGSYAHATVSGPGLIPHIIDSDGGEPQLAELPGFGAGSVVFGGLTTSNFWTPALESLNLRANVIAYLGGKLTVPSDADGDGVPDQLDNCPVDPNTMQEDDDMDDVGNLCDPCLEDPDNDIDEDMLCGDVDNCPGDENPMQEDDDMDGLGNVCDPCPVDPEPDADSDTVCNGADNCPDDPNTSQEDTDMDALGDACDACPADVDNDIDGDGICGDVDNCPDDANEDQVDTDDNGLGDACDEIPGTTGGSDGNDDTADSGETDGSGGGNETTGGGTSGGPVDPSDGDTGNGVDGTGDSASTGDASAGSSDDQGGCDCSADADGGPARWSMLGLIAMLGLRRRRRAA